MDVYPGAGDVGALLGWTLEVLEPYGFTAALGHAPDAGGRHRLVVFSFPHIGIDPHDVEESLLVQRLRDVLGDSPVPDLPRVTELVRVSALDELRLLLSDLSTSEVGVDYALFSGVVVHGVDTDRVDLVSAEATVGGWTTDLLAPASM